MSPKDIPDGNARTRISAIATLGVALLIGAGWLLQLAVVALATKRAGGA